MRYFENRYADMDLFCKRSIPIMAMCSSGVLNSNGLRSRIIANIIAVSFLITAVSAVLGDLSFAFVFYRIAQAQDLPAFPFFVAYTLFCTAILNIFLTSGEPFCLLPNAFCYPLPDLFTLGIKPIVSCKLADSFLKLSKLPVSLISYCSGRLPTPGIVISKDLSPANDKFCSNNSSKALSFQLSHQIFLVW